MTAMLRGDYLEAWRINALVMAARDPASRDDPRLPYHLRWVWDGRPFQGRRILVRCYHGLGDTLQFARYLPVLRSFAVSLTVEAQPELLPILSSVAGIDRLIPFVHDAPAPHSECDMEIMELPFALKLTPDAIPPLRLSIRSTPAFEGAIGLCWEAGNWDPGRSIPSNFLEPFTTWPCITLQTCPTELNVLNRQGCPRDMVATASLVAGLDLVITVDTMIAHLAGAQNRLTWLLLKHQPDWRWMAGRSDSPWYPSLRIYRQPAPGDWPAVITQITEEFAAARSRSFEGGQPARASAAACGQITRR